MSAILTGLLQPQIAKAVASWTGTTAGDPTGAGAITSQQKFILELSQGIALAVMQYLNTSVLSLPGHGVAVTTVGGPTNQAGGGTTISPAKLSAP